MNAPKDIDLGGVVVAPFGRYLIVAVIAMLLIKAIVGRLGLRNLFANPPLAEAALYVCILVAVMVYFV